VLRRMCSALTATGMVAIEDIDFAGCFCHPPNAAFTRYCELYARSRGAPRRRRAVGTPPA
jgi:hypothetical protein